METHPHDGESGGFPERWQIGDLIDNQYKIHRIHKGGMGVVYICVDQRTKTPCALKTYQDKYFQDEKAKKRFVREAYNWIHIETHVNIVRAFGLLELSGKPYILLEYVHHSGDGRNTLRDYIGRGLSVNRALLVAFQFCDGMVHATSKVKGIVHRDIKPENIMITPEFIVKITDFGLAKAVAKPSEKNWLEIAGHELISNDVFVSNEACGTPPYMSPEQIVGAAVDTRSDIYSFGAVLYEMLTGSRVFPVATAREYVRCHLERVPTEPSSLNPEIPSELSELVMKCLEKNPKQRHESFRDLGIEFDRLGLRLYGKEFPHQIGPPSQASELANKGMGLFRLGQEDEGITILRQALEMDPSLVDSHACLGEALYTKGRTDEAIEEYKRAMELDPNDWRVHLDLGASYDAKGWTDEAIREYERTIELCPDNAKPHFNLAQAFIDKGWIERAETELRRTIELDPSEARAHYNLGVIYGKRGWNDKAVTAYTHAIVSDPYLVDAYLNLSRIYVSQGTDLDRATSLAIGATELSPNNANAHLALGCVYFKRNLLAQAAAEMEITLKLKPDSVSAYTVLGWIYDSTGSTDRAISMFEKALELDPRNSENHYNLARQYYRSSNFDSAWKHLRIAEKLGGIPPQYIETLIESLRKVSKETQTDR